MTIKTINLKIFLWLSTRSRGHPPPPPKTDGGVESARVCVRSCALSCHGLDSAIGPHTIHKKPRGIINVLTGPSHLCGWVVATNGLRLIAARRRQAGGPEPGPSAVAPLKLENLHWRIITVTCSFSTNWRSCAIQAIQRLFQVVWKFENLKI